MNAASCCLGDVAERVENVSEWLASRDHLEQTPLAGEKRLREFQVVDGDRLHCASLTMRHVGRSANHTLVSASIQAAEDEVACEDEEVRVEKAVVLVQHVSPHPPDPHRLPA